MEDDSKKKLFIVIGLLFIFAGILLNEWVLAALFAADGVIEGRSNKIIIWGFDIISVFVGILILRSRNKGGIEYIRSKYIALSLIGFNILIIFCVLNIFFIILDKVIIKTNDSTVGGWYSPSEKYCSDKKFIHNIYNGTVNKSYSDEDISQLIKPPGVTCHPTLEFMEIPITSKFYNVGFENMRYTKYVNADNAKDKINGAIWIFGGSTTFGHGISDNETIPYYLNDLDPSSVYINFGVQAYHQNLEIEKLLLLLKKGYRPKSVIFIDGLNDISAMKATNFSPAETPMRCYSSYGYLFNIGTISKKSFLHSLPLFDFLQKISKRKSKDMPSVSNGYDNIYDPLCVYHKDPVSHYNLISSYEETNEQLLENIDLYKNKVVEYYRRNNNFLKNVAKSYNFDFFVFFQPLGNLSLKNPFLKDRARHVTSPHYKYYKSMSLQVIDIITNGQLPNFYNISDVDTKCLDCYVDGTHYNPKLCKMIANRILSITKDSAQAK